MVRDYANPPGPTESDHRTRPLGIHRRLTTHSHDRCPVPGPNRHTAQLDSNFKIPVGEDNLSSP